MPELNEINDSLAEFQEELSKLKSASEIIEDAKTSAQLTISESKKMMEELISSSKRATDSAIQESKKLNESAEKLLSAVDILLKKLDKVDFPARLDKLDTTAIGINTSIQNIFRRFETIERNLKDDFRDRITLVQEKLINSQKVNLILLIILALITGSSLTLIILKFGQ